MHERSNANPCVHPDRWAVCFRKDSHIFFRKQCQFVIAQHLPAYSCLFLVSYGLIESFSWSLIGLVAHKVASISLSSLDSQSRQLCPMLNDGNIGICWHNFRHWCLTYNTTLSSCICDRMNCQSIIFGVHRFLSRSERIGYSFILHFMTFPLKYGLQGFHWNSATMHFF